MLYRGLLRSLCYVDGMAAFLSTMGVLLKNFGEYVQPPADKNRSRG